MTGTTSANLPKVSVIIPAYNAAATIGPCLRALQDQTFRQAIEIIVVDDGSDDATAAIAEEAGARVISTPRRRPAAARNAGIAAATGDIICCTDADCEPAPDWLEQITLPLQQPRIVACKGTYATRQRSLVARFVQLEYEDKYDLMVEAATIDFIDTYSAAYRRSDLVASGGFDERFVYLEDQELSFRLAAAGHAMVFQPSAVVYHHHADSLQAYMRKKSTIGYWKVQVVRRFPERLVRDSHTPQVMKLQMLLAAVLLGSAAVFVVSILLGWDRTSTTAGLVATAAVITFLLTTLPFLRKAWVKDRVMALVAPGLLLARAISLGAGTAWGIAAPPTALSKSQPIASA